MRTIYKYPLVDANQNVITGHFEAFLKLDYQGKIPTVWAITDNDRMEEVIKILKTLPSPAYLS